MGTRGFIVLRYRSRYHVIFNRYDSYFEGLGYGLIRSIKELTKEEWEEIKAKLVAHETSDGTNDSEEEDCFVGEPKKENIILKVMKHYNGSKVVREEPKLDVWIEYIYILDLDVDVFTAISRHHKDEDAPYEEMRYTCRFENLSKEWLDSLESW